MRRSRNVVLAEFLMRESVPLSTGRGPAIGQAGIERLIPPLPTLAEAAEGTAAFPVPKYPVQLSRYWTFKRDAGDIPTLPVVALHAFSLDVHDVFAQLLRTAGGAQAASLPPRTALGVSHKIDRAARALRDVFLADEQLAERMRRSMNGVVPALDAGRRRRLEALIRTYESPSSPYLDLYGPPGTIPTVPFSQVLTSPETAASFTGKAVFVGLSGQFRSEQRDGFHTVFSDPSGLDISGVEIAATAFANLLEGRRVRPPESTSLVVGLLLGGLALGAACRLLRPVAAIATGLAVGVVYVVVAVNRFAADGTWLPLVVPLFLQIPLAVGGAILWRYVEADRAQKAIRHAVSYYLPPNVIEQALAKAGGVGSTSELVYGVCLATDAERYTALGELLEPRELASFMNRYYAAVFEPIRRHGGVISDVVGDAALAIWVASDASDSRRLRQSSCEAACDVATAIERFNGSDVKLRLPTRVGLHSGPMALGNVGAMDHYEYAVVGDVVNTASRIQGLNKTFGTRVLASEDVVSGLVGLLTRRLGAFVVVGRSTPITVYELLGRRDGAHEADLARCSRFDAALTAYEHQRWDDAEARFRAIIEAHGDDGPSRLYLTYCARYREAPPDTAWDPVIRVEVK
jgi:adenylate cyclase